MGNFSAKERRILMLLEMYAEEGSTKFMLDVFAIRYYTKFHRGEKRPTNWRSSMVQGLRTLNLKLKEHGGKIERTSGLGRSQKAAYTFSGCSGLLDD